MPLRPPAGFIRPGFDPLKNPNAPTIGIATGGNAQLSVTFTAPSNVGGSAITGYVVAARKTSDNTSVGASGSASPIVVTGLTNDAAYTATVAAVNSYGPSASSAASNSVTPRNVPAPGATLGGGFFAGQISTSGNGVADYNLVVGPLSSAQNNSIQYKTSGTATAGTDSFIDGPTNSANMNNASHPAAQFCEGLTIGGFSDWYMPAKNELEVCYYTLKPTTQDNGGAFSGINPNAVPSRGSAYTTNNPAQTSAAAFQSGGTEAFTNTFYWSSTQKDDQTDKAWRQYFASGDQTYSKKYNNNRVRAVRRVPV